MPASNCCDAVGAACASASRPVPRYAIVPTVTGVMTATASATAARPRRAPRDNPPGVGFAPLAVTEELLLERLDRRLSKNTAFLLTTGGAPRHRNENYARSRESTTRRTRTLA